jgi:uncharacterized membrane protein
MVDRLSFRWSYIVAPVVVFLLSIILFASFYHMLPAEVAVRFDVDGAPEMWLGRVATMLWMLLPQLLLVLLAWGVAWGATRLDTRWGWARGGGVKAGRIVSFMGNILALPQLIILFAMLDILSYNAYQTHILPMWLFLIIVLALMTAGLLGLGVFIYLKARQSMSQADK